MKGFYIFKYLGSIIYKKKENCTEILMKEGGKLEYSWWQLYTLWEVDTSKKQGVHRAYYVPILIYSAEAWTTTGIRNMQANKITFLRSIKGVLRNEEIRGTCRGGVTARGNWEQIEQYGKTDFMKQMMKTNCQGQSIRRKWREGDLGADILAGLVRGKEK